MRTDWTLLNVQQAEPGVLQLRIDNPPLGLLNQVVRQELGSLFQEVGGTTDVRCVVFGSGDRSFCAGADLKEYPLRFDPSVARAHVENAHRMILALVECDTPVIAAVRGACMGGGMELALGCSYRIAARSSTFALPEVKRGAWPGTGGTALLTRLVRPSIAKRLLYTGETLTGEKARDLGLVDELVDDETLHVRASELAAVIASQPRTSVATMAQLLDRDFRANLRAHLRDEAERFVQAYQLPAAREGYSAFFEKREPRWQQS